MAPEGLLQRSDKISWLVDQLQPMVTYLLSPERARVRGLFDAGAVQWIVDAFSTVREDNDLRIWALLTLEFWQQAFVDQPTRRSADEVVAL